MRLLYFFFPYLRYQKLVKRCLLILKSIEDLNTVVNDEHGGDAVVVFKNADYRIVANFSWAMIRTAEEIKMESWADAGSIMKALDITVEMGRMNALINVIREMQSSRERNKFYGELAANTLNAFASPYISKEQCSEIMKGMCELSKYTG